MDPLVCGYFSIANTTVLHDLWLLEICRCGRNVNCEYEGTTVSYMWLSESESESESRSVVSDSLWPHGLYSPWNSPGQNTRVGTLSLLQGIFPTEGSNPGLLHYRQIVYQLSHKGSPRILEWVAYPFSSRSSWPRNWTQVSCIAGGFFTNWVIKEAPSCSRVSCYYVYGVMMLLIPHS